MTNHRSKKKLLAIYSEAMDSSWAVVKKYDLNWTETLGCYEFMQRAFQSLMHSAADEAGIEIADES